MNFACSREWFKSFPGQMFALLAILLFNVVLLDAQSTQCQKRSCYPATGNLLVGREASLEASSTCGLKGPEKFCIVSHLKTNKKCFWCDSRQGVHPDNRHSISSIISSFDKDRDKLWWQSENGVESVFIQLDLEAEFHFTHLIMTFKTFRPAGMLIERSADYGRTWKVYRYFSYDCGKIFPGIRKGPPRVVGDIICTEKYSAVEPSTKGEVIFRALNPQLPVKDPYSSKIQDLLKMTNIRVNFTRLHNLGDSILDDRPETKQKYYYALYDVVIRGSCSCYGHAEECVSLPGSPLIPGMVYGQCNCTHYTEGRNCEKCKPGYNDQPWRPATQENTNECKKCICNNHSNKCHFDMAVYLASGNVSGGVCVDCQHNTIGRKCEKCKPLHYQDPTRTPQDPDVCVPCDCDPVGGTTGGECVPKSDPANGLIAGQCLCKSHVEGVRCDRCKRGYWNLNSENPDGCQPCRCDPLGTLGDLGCDTSTGICTCKRFVEGQRCDKCLPGYWGIGSVPAGCQTCQCNAGGSYDNMCDQNNGQCRCRRGLTGRKCDEVIPGYYFGFIDNLKFEAETANSVGDGKVEVRERLSDTVSWTGEGYQLVVPNSIIKFGPIRDIPKSGRYSIMLRYSPKISGSWQAEVRVKRLDGKDLHIGDCANELPTEGKFPTTLSDSKRYMILSQTVCLSEGVDYMFEVEFKRHSSSSNTAELLFDSLVLIPDMNSLSIFQGEEGQRRKYLFDRYKCMNYHLEASVPSPEIPDKCKELFFAASAIIHDGALPCYCDASGTEANPSGGYVCNSIGGQCPCKDNVIGRRCTRCVPGSFGFGDEGCAACECDLSGSLDNLCDIKTGQCKCADMAKGRQCNECPPKHWGFPLCEACECNNHADSCDPLTGFCIDCKHNTAGSHCEKCAQGYYGEALLGSETGCQQCQCPGGSSGNQFSESCHLDETVSPATVICDRCLPGYEGLQCERCSDGYFGNPLVPGGSCELCECSGNIDLGETRNCDRATGECLKCLHNTAGFRCDKCKPGYYGSAENRTCLECVCNQLGTDFTFGGICDHTTGQCPCLPNVIGLECDQCAAGHWNLASIEGCQNCSCCKEGSFGEDCDPIDGQCACKQGFGGQKCCECENDFWGIPPGQCYPCNCNPAGSLQSQCNRDNGKCICKPGVIGEKCDMCAPHTSGKMPTCEKCHPCYLQWFYIIDRLAENITSILERAKKVKFNSTTGGGYESELEALRKKLAKVQKILDNPVTSKEDVDLIENGISEVTDKLADFHIKVMKINDQLMDTDQRTGIAKEELEKLEALLADLLKQANQLRANATAIRDTDIEGIYNATREHLRRSREAQKKVDNADKDLDESAKSRGKITDIYAGPPDIESQHKKNQDNLTDILLKIQGLERQVEVVNGLVCGKQSGCGGCEARDCDNCGGVLCGGATTLAEQALEKAQDAEELMRDKEGLAKDTLEEVMDAEDPVNEAKAAAQKALDDALRAKRRAEDANNNLTALINEILDFLNNKSGVNPDDIRGLVEIVLNKKLSVTPDEILELDRMIKEALENLKNVDEILKETASGILDAQALKEEAERARDRAQAALAAAKNVIDALKKAKEAQDAAQSAIDQANADIKMVQDKLNELNGTSQDAQKKANKNLGQVKDMQSGLVDILLKFEENKKLVGEGEKESSNAEGKSLNAEEKAEELKRLFANITSQLKGNVTEPSEDDRIVKLKERARNLNGDLTIKLKKLKVYQEREIKFQDLIDELKALEKEMTTVMNNIGERVSFYRTCSPYSQPNK